MSTGTCRLSTLISQNHADLLMALATRTDYRGARDVKTRGTFGEQLTQFGDEPDAPDALLGNSYSLGRSPVHGRNG